MAKKKAKAQKGYVVDSLKICLTRNRKKKKGGCERRSACRKTHGAKGGTFALKTRCGLRRKAR